MANADDIRYLKDEMASEYDIRQKSISEIKDYISTLLVDLKGQDKERASEIAKLKAEFDRLISDFRVESKERMARVNELLADFKGRDKERDAEVARLIEGFRREQADTAAAWQDLLATMRSKRGAAQAGRAPRRMRAAEVRAARAA